jgi:hypothetical protein
VLVDPEVERVLGHHAEHHPVAKHAGLAKHAPHRQVAKRRQLLAQEFGKAVAGNQVAFLLVLDDAALAQARDLLVLDDAALAQARDLVGVDAA